MLAPNPETVLRIWEETRFSHPVRRALALLDAAWPEVGPETWASTPIGRRDACLLHLYETLFGSDINAIARCPECGERIDARFTAAKTGFGPSELPGAVETYRLRDGAYDLQYRLPNSTDLLDLAEAGPAAAVLELVERCLDRAMHLDRPVPTADIPAPVIARLAEAISEQDPGAEMRVGLTCPGCGHQWAPLFEITAYLSAELDDWAQRLLADVHALAIAYGWSEREVVALSPGRRQLYLEMVAG
jgi:hypothetical protein